MLFHGLWFSSCLQVSASGGPALISLNDRWWQTIFSSYFLWTWRLITARETVTKTTGIKISTLRKELGDYLGLCGRPFSWVAGEPLLRMVIWAEKWQPREAWKEENHPGGHTGNRVFTELRGINNVAAQEGGRWVERNRCTGACLFTCLQAIPL